MKSVHENRIRVSFPIGKRLGRGTNVPVARLLRKRLTPAERFLWRHLSGKQIEGYRFRKQHPIGRYVVDFFCFEELLAIELDGGGHNAQEEYDSLRTAWMESQGIRVLRFWNNDVLTNIEGVRQVILDTLREGLPPSQSCPSGGRGNVPSDLMRCELKTKSLPRRGKVRKGANVSPTV